MSSLTSDILAQSLSRISKTVDGTGYAFTRLDVKDKGLTDLGEDIVKYQHIRHINVSNNQIEDISSVVSLPHLLSIDAQSNSIQALEPFNQDGLQFLQILNLSKNQITSLTAVKLPLLRSLNLNENQIETAETFPGHDQIQELELRSNKLTSLVGVRNIPRLQKLYLAENELESLTGLEALPALEYLHVRHNKISSLDGLVDLPNLKSINLRENAITSVEELAKLKELPNLKTIAVSGNPFVDEFGDTYRKEILIVISTLSKIDKEDVTAEERAEAIEEAATRKAEAEAEAAAAAAEAEAAAAEREGAEDEEEEDDN
eukprot:GILK01001970.1.p1 GENE.GILK01001970.1~~GILK01001970.1.p1  ORF type:complete len:331 (-),score=82.86 GILK01001970.1:137-1087(-)